MICNIAYIQKSSEDAYLCIYYSGYVQSMILSKRFDQIMNKLLLS